MKVPAPTLAPILRSAAQGRILARVLNDPESSYSLSDLVSWSNTSMPTVQREIGRAEEAGIVVTEKVGPTRLVRANVDHPLHDAVRRVVLATYGPPAVIADVFGYLDGADAVLLFGSWAARYLGQRGPAPNDIDVLVVGTPDRDAVDDRAAEAERRIGLPVQATVRDRTQWDSNEESFLQEVRSRPLVPVLVDEDDAEFTAEMQRLPTNDRLAP
jgi:predicted nucleotidyltransferase